MQKIIQGPLVQTINGKRLIVNCLMETGQEPVSFLWCD